MSADDIVVIGAGIAGTAAAWAACEGARVVLIDGGAGASSFASGAIDRAPWESLDRAMRTPGATLAQPKLDARTTAFVTALGAWEIGREQPVWLATLAGRVRPALGRDRALLDLGTLAHRRVLVPRADRASWDADALVRAWNEEAPRALDVTFEAIDAPVLRYADERSIADGEIAMRHDDPARLGWLADRLKAAIARSAKPTAVIVGPWLGADQPRAEELSRLLGVPVGEALSGNAGSAGLRFEAARDRLLAGKASVVRGRVASLRRDGGDVVVAFSGERTSVRARSVVLAIGGLVGGGIVFRPPEYGSGWDGTAVGRASFKLSLDVEAALVGGLDFGVVASLHGLVLDETAWPSLARDGALESVGLGPRNETSALHPAGDVRRGFARTALEAVASGLAAGAAASGARGVEETAGAAAS